MFEMIKCPKCGGKVDNIALLCNPPIYKNICENCGELNINDMIKPMIIHPSNEIYLIWERHSYCDYGVVYTTLDRRIANEMLNKLNSEHNHDSGYVNERFALEVLELDKHYKKEW